MTQDSAPVGAGTSYTGTGDDGTSTLGDLSRTPKTNTRLVAYGELDQASSAIGMTIAFAPELSEEVTTALVRVQNDLLDLGADVCAPVNSQSDAALRINDRYIERVERACDHFGQDLSPQPNFVLPGGTSTAAMLHNARAIVLRAERSVWRAVAEHGDSMNHAPGRYLNRLSHLLFILARLANVEHGDTVWEAGLSGSQAELELWEQGSAA